MKAIDFSCKHHILIRHKDGTLTPMDEPYYEVTQIAPDTWQIMSSGDYHYLLAGEDEAIAIDTSYGAGNLREFLEDLCGKPVRKVINTHHHFDHSANNCYFDLAYMAAESVDLAAIPYPSFEGIDFPRTYEVQIVDDEDTVPLKGRGLEIIKIGDHTAGGIAILDRKQHLLFTGDEMMPGGKMVSGSIEKFATDMQKIMARRDLFDWICGGPEILPAEVADIFYEASVKMLHGEETEGAGGMYHGPRPGRAEPDGQIIYDCQHPHPEDIPKGKRPGGNGEMKTLLHRGYRFGYHSEV